MNELPPRSITRSNGAIDAPAPSSLWLARQREAVYVHRHVGRRLDARRNECAAAAQRRVSCQQRYEGGGPRRTSGNETMRGSGMASSDAAALRLVRRGWESSIEKNWTAAAGRDTASDLDGGSSNPRFKRMGNLVDTPICAVAWTSGGTTSIATMRNSGMQAGHRAVIVGSVGMNSRLPSTVAPFTVGCNRRGLKAYVTTYRDRREDVDDCKRTLGARRGTVSTVLAVGGHQRR